MTWLVCFKKPLQWRLQVHLASHSLRNKSIFLTCHGSCDEHSSHLVQQRHIQSSSTQIHHQNIKHISFVESISHSSSCGLIDYSQNAEPYEEHRQQATLRYASENCSSYIRTTSAITCWGFLTTLTLSKVSDLKKVVL